MISPGAPPDVRLDDVEVAVARIRSGRPIVVIDDQGREDDGVLVVAAELATAEVVAFMVRYTSGFICVSMPEADGDRLGLPPMHPVDKRRRGAAYPVSFDAQGTAGTGSSATDRAQTIRVLADARTRTSDLTRPGHVVVLRSEPGGVLSRPGHTEASTDLAGLAGLRPVGVLCELVSQQDPTQMANRAELREFCDEHGLAMISIASLITHRRQRESSISRRMQAQLPLPQGSSLAVGYRTALDTREHLALVHGDISSGEDVLVRVQSECLLGDVFGSRACQCKSRLDAALSVIAEEGRGVLLYLRSHPQQAVDLFRQVTHVDAELSLLSDEGERGTAAHVLTDLGIRSLRMLTSTPVKWLDLEGYGLQVLDQIPLPLP
jgi:3,4-dihydroxy 2-butanone 4-phosphate synthase/GTP cyclohydrolase II